MTKEIIFEVLLLKGKYKNTTVEVLTTDKDFKTVRDILFEADFLTSELEENEFIIVDSYYTIYDEEILKNQWDSLQDFPNDEPII